MPILQPQTSQAAKKATNVSINETLLTTARSLKINVSKAAEHGLFKAVADKKAELWLEENRQALESSNTYVEKYGLPLAKYQQF
ncbi:MAG TPA: post-segregation antitoxin CcdA [Gammaproteobacteria bacterium]|jgi:antitoxin CcdA|nr:post-segregation antitoxin CcdA [Gammaproteobacteria bacterium]